MRQPVWGGSRIGKRCIGKMRWFLFLFFLFLFWFGGGALDDEVVVDAEGAGG